MIDTNNPPASDALAAEDIEVRLLLDGLMLRYGYDFRQYAGASLRRRLRAVMLKFGYRTISQLQHELLHRPDLFHTLLSELTVTTSEMFRDPRFFRALREQVVPVLRTYPVFRIWHAGCSSGEEVYSLAILLQEEGLSDKAVIYATDINPAALARAKEGIFPAESVKQYTANYQASGGREPFSKYYTAAYGSVRFDPALRSNVLFSEHNLVTDDVFAEMQLILCRNVLIYFNRDLQQRVLSLFSRSLSYKGFLGLGSKETVRFISGADQYEDVDTAERLYRRAAKTRSDTSEAN